MHSIIGLRGIWHSHYAGAASRTLYEPSARNTYIRFLSHCFSLPNVSWQDTAKCYMNQLHPEAVFNILLAGRIRPGRSLASFFMEWFYVF